MSATFSINVAIVLVIAGLVIPNLGKLPSGVDIAVWAGCGMAWAAGGATVEYCLGEDVVALVTLEKITYVAGLTITLGYSIVLAAIFGLMNDTIKRIAHITRPSNRRGDSEMTSLDDNGPRGSA